MSEVQNEIINIKQGAAGGLRMELLAGDVLKAVQKGTQAALVETADAIASGARRDAPVDESKGSDKRRKKMGRKHMKDEIRSGPSEFRKFGVTHKSAYVNAQFPSAFVELGHDIVEGGRKRKRKTKDRKRKKSTKRKLKKGGTVSGHVEGRPFIKPNADRELRKLPARAKKHEV